MAESRHTDSAVPKTAPDDQAPFPRTVELTPGEARERRATSNAERYWDMVRGGNPVPKLSDIDMEQSSALWNNRFLIRRDREITQSVFIVCGLEARRAIGLPALGRCLGEVLPRSIAEEVYQACDMANRDSRPEHLQGVFTGHDGRQMLFRSVFMPLRALSNDLGYVFGAFSARARSN